MSINVKAITYTEFGDLNKVLQESQYTIDASNLQPNQVLLKTLANSINPSDKVQILGVYVKGKLHTINGKETYIGGNEGLFKVEKVGANVKLQVGDWVIPGTSGTGTWRTHVLTTEEEVIKVSDGKDSLTFEQGATLAVNPPTAVQLVEEINDWKPNDWIIQNSGNSQVSRFVTQLASHINVNTISIVRGGKTQAELDLLKKLGATVIVTEEEFAKNEFFDNLPKLTNNGNIRLALDSLGGPTTEGLIRSLSQDGLFITYGASTGQNISYPGRYQLLKNLTTKAYWLTHNIKKDPQAKAGLIKKVIDYYKKGILVDNGFLTVPYDGNLLQTYLKAINAKTNKQVVVFES